MRMAEHPYLIIGATRGIGRALAETLIARGARVITVARGAEGVPCGEHIVADVVQDGLPEEALPNELAGLAYCPGSIDLKPFRSIKPEELRAAFELNVVGAFRCAQQCAERLKRVPGSSIVFFSTVAVQRGMAFHTSVASAKGALEGLTRSLAAELAPTVRVNCIAPSLTRTSLAEKLLSSPERERASADRHALKRVGEPVDIAAMAAFLLSDEAHWITGQIIGVDGGLSAI